MHIKKRDGRLEPIKLDKITKSIEKMSYKLHKHVDPIKVAIKTIDGIYDGVTSIEVDNLAAEIAATMSTIHPDYSILAARIAVRSLHKSTSDSFTETIQKLYSYVNPRNKKWSPLVTRELYDIVNKHKELLESEIIKNNDFNYDYFGFRTLERSYLFKCDGKIVERPQYMLMRVALGIHGSDIDEAIKTYQIMSNKIATHATPTLFNSGTPKPQMSSCFLLDMKDDSIDGIYDTLKQTAKISQSAGGIGIAMHKIRASGSYIGGTNGTSNGLVPMLKVFNDTARYVDQGGGKRKGSFAIYLEPWHADIFEVMDLKKNHGKEELRARDLFYAIWNNDLFMRRIEEDGDWTLMCPNECPGLDEVYGEAFDTLYESYEAQGKGRRTIKARLLWDKILESQIETGTPYMVHKDAANSKSNQKNIGVIKSSNLCTEIIEHTSPDEVAVCNLASISLPAFVKKGKFNFSELRDVTRQLTRNINKIIDVNYYPVKEGETSNLRHRPIGLGVQGLADVFAILDLPFESEEAQILNRQIFEHIYFAALTESMELSKKYGQYETFEGSPTSFGILQFDMWPNFNYELLSPELDWTGLKADIIEFGLRNSLLVAPMPTASTSQILGNNEAFEPFTSNMYTRRTLSGEFIVTNKHLLNKLIELGLWNDAMRQKLMAANGSVQNIPEIPTHVKEVYKTVWEMSMKNIINMSRDRGFFVDQSQSLNLFMQDANPAKLTSMHFYAWKQGLKTGMYYLRTKAAVDAIKFTVSNDKKPVEDISMTAEEYKAMIEKARNSEPEDCEMCGS